MHPSRTSHLLVLAAMFLLGSLVAACAGGAVASGAPSASPAPAASAVASTGAVTSPEQAAALVLGQDPEFTGIPPKDPDLIGGCCFYEVTEEPEGYLVTIEVGWGDCISGCIDKHRWTYAVKRSGEVGLIGESGTPVPPGGIPERP